MSDRRPVLLVVLDGWGLRESREANAVAMADTPVFDGLMEAYPHTRLRTSGQDVGLPEGQMGNSEVGHLTMGAGAVFDQDLLRIDKAAAAGELAGRPALRALFEGVTERGSALHLAGLLGEGGVHAHARHLTALLRAAKAAGLSRVYLHAFTDGRDAPPHSGLEFMQDLCALLDAEDLGQVASVVGRYYGMDRDRRWPRTQRAWELLRDGAESAERRAKSATEAIEEAYEAGETDEFIQPTAIVDAQGRSVARIEDGDGVLLVNFRADRMRQLLAALTDPGFEAFEIDRPAGLQVVTLTEYVDGQPAPAIFEPQDVEYPLGRVIAEAGLAQHHTAETEKYAHVTYFFNGGREHPFAGETRRLVPSPQVATYDLQPEMSAPELCAALVERIREGGDQFLLVNFANPDMVGHSGDLQAAIRAVETVDRCLGTLLDAVAEQDGIAVVTADHGNCEQMIDPETGGPHTAHTRNPVPLIVVAPEMRTGSSGSGLRLQADGGLCDVAPTVLELLELHAPAAMTGRSLLLHADCDSTLRPVSSPHYPPSE